MLATIVDFFFPRHCLDCGQKGDYLCLRCLDKIPPAEPVDTPCTFACFHYYHPPIKRALQMLKYKRQWSIATDLARSLHDKLLEELADYDLLEHRTEKFLLVPVPLSHERLRERGYNQAKVLAEELQKLNPELFEVNSHVIKKIKDTPSQVSVRDRAKRLANLSGAFALAAPETIKGRVVIIIDDVITTGATITEIKRVLRAAEPNKIYALAVAHG